MKNIIKIIITILVIKSSILNASSPLNLNGAIEILKSNNLEIKSAALDVSSAREEAKTVSGNHWGKLELFKILLTLMMPVMFLDSN